MSENDLAEPFNRLLAEHASPVHIRQIEATGSIAVFWGKLVDSGFLDAMVPEAAGGAGLTLRAIAPLLIALGYHAVPAPVGETMMARTLLARAGLDYPAEPIVLAQLHNNAAHAVPHARVADYALLETDGRLVLMPLAQARVIDTGISHSLAAHLSWSGGLTGPSCATFGGGLRAAAAMVRAAAIAGAAARLLEITIGYANERSQFGKPIGKQQAIQQQLAVLAEQTLLARLAAQAAFIDGHVPSLAAAAAAKAVTSRAASQIAAIAHAVHGAIGISEAYDLQLYTRRLYEWRLADGSEQYWARLLGRLRLAQSELNSVDAIRDDFARLA